MAQKLGIEKLRHKLSVKQTRVSMRYNYYEMKNTVRDLQISTPPALKGWFSSLGWCAKGVDKLADRLVFREFRNDTFDLNEIFNMNNPDILTRSAVLSALIASCSFIYISRGEDETPRLQVIDASRATGCIDPITGLLTEGYAILTTDEHGRVETEAYFDAGATYYYEYGKHVRTDKYNCDFPLLVPVIFKPDAKRPFGHSRISRACMEHVNAALRTLKRAEITAEFYSFPQKWITGLSDDADELDKWRASMSSILAFTKDSQGDSPSLGQFSSASMGPHVEHLRMLASLFGAEVDLTLDDMGFPTENPASSEAIKSAHENLRLTATSAQKTFGSGFLNAGYLAACVRDDYAYQRSVFYKTRPIWEPVFEPDLSALSMIGDAMIKMQQAIPGYFGRNNLYDLTGIRPEEE